MASCVSTYLTAVRKRRVLTRAEECELAVAAAEGSEPARRRLIEAHLGFVVQVARRYAHCGVPLEDLMSAGNLGLLMAARRYDPEEGVRFVTYAVWWVRKAILEALRLHNGQVSTPHRALTRAQEREDALGTPGRPLPLRPGATISLDAAPPGKTSLLEKLHDPGSPSPELLTMTRQMNAILREALLLLEPRERQVVVLRYGLDGRSPLTLEAIGQELGLSRERIRQIDVQARDRLRKILQRRNPAARGRLAGASPRMVRSFAGSSLAVSRCRAPAPA